MKAFLSFATVESDEPLDAQMFIDGYQSTGRLWTGVINTQEHVSSSALAAMMPDLINQGYDIVFNAYKCLDTLAQISAFAPYANTILWVMPAGSNSYRLNLEFAYPRSDLGVMIGSGAFNNITAYPCQFWGHSSDAAEQPLPISSMTQGSPTLTYVDISSSSYFLAGMGITLFDVTGFANNPNGEFENQSYSSTQARIPWVLGSGSLTGGKIQAVTQSYATCYQAGLLALIKDVCECSWVEARSRAIVTSTLFPYRDPMNGYGNIRVQQAIDLPSSECYIRKGSIELFLPYEGSGFLYTIGDNNVRLKLAYIPFAEEIEIYEGNSLLATTTNGITYYDFTMSTQRLNTNPYTFRYRGKTGNTYGEFSDPVQAHTKVYYTKFPIKLHSKPPEE